MRAHRGSSRVRSGALAVLLVVGLLVGVRVWVWEALEREYAASRAEALPLTLAELDSWYPWPKGENAAETIMKAVSGLERDDETADESSATAGLIARRLLDGMAPDPDVSAAEALLEKSRPLLDALHTASGSPAARYLPRIEGTQLPGANHLNIVRAAAQWLLLEGAVAVHKADSISGVRAVHALFGLAETLRNEPLLPAQFDRMAVRLSAVDLLAALLSRTAIEGAALDALTSAFDEPSGEPYRRGFAGTRCLLLQAYDAPGDPSMPVTRGVQTTLDAFISMLDMGLRRLSGLHDYDRLRYLRASRSLVRVVSLPYIESQPEELRIADDIAESPKRIAPLAPKLFNELLGFMPYIARDRAAVLLARTAVAVESYRALHGCLPSALNDLVAQYLAEVPADPFADGLLRYRPLNPGYVVYSVGKNVTDEQGRVLESPGAQWFEGDQVFVVRR